MMYEELGLGKSVPIIARYYDYERFTFPLHFHSEYEIIYFEEGEGKHFVADRTGVIRPGDIILTGSNVPHFMRSAEKHYAGDASARVRGVVIQFAHNYMSFAIGNYADLQPVRTLLETAGRGIHFPPPDNAALVKSIRALPKLKDVRRMTALLLLLDQMANFQPKRLLGTSHFHPNDAPAADGRLDKVLAYIHRNYTKEIRLDDIMEIISMNRSAFCRYFRSRSNRSLTDYIQELRVGQACKLLSGSMSDILYIGVKCGFNTPSHFNKVFKRHTGLTPSEYRKQFMQNMTGG